MSGRRTCLPCHIPDRWSRNANRIWPDLAFGFVHKRSGNEISSMQMSYSYASDLPFKNFCKLAKQAETIKNRFWLIKHCLGNSQINSIPAWSFLNFSLQNTRKSLRVSASRYYSFTARNERNFRPWKLTFSWNRSIKVHRRALVSYSQPSLWKIRKRI